MIRGKSRSRGPPDHGSDCKPSSNTEATDVQPGGLYANKASSKPRITSATAETAMPANRNADRPGRRQVGRASWPWPARIARARAVAIPHLAGARKNEKPGSRIKVEKP